MQTTERINRIKKWIVDYCKSMPIEAKTLVIGVSGGIDSSVTSTLCALTGPLISTSANISGLPPLKSADENEEVFNQEIDYVLAGELGKLGKPTQIKDILTGEVLR